MNEEKPGQVIIIVCNCITEREEVELFLYNNLNSICNTLDDYQYTPRIPHIQINISPLKIRIADLNDQIGVGYFAFDYHIPSISGQRKKKPLQKTQPFPKNNSKSQYEKSIPLL